MGKDKETNKKPLAGRISSVVKLFKKPKIAVLALVVLVALGFYYFKKTQKNNQKPQHQTAPVERGTIISSVSASGQVLSVNIMSANSKASGIIKKVYVKDGDIVRKNDKILEIDLDFQGEQKKVAAWSSYLSAKNTLEAAKATQYSLQADMFDKWDTFKELAEGDDYEESDGTPKYNQRALPEFHIPEKEWLATELKYKNQEAVITQAQVALNNAWLNYNLASPIITAPTNGAITSLMFAEGMSIGALDTGNITSNQKVATIKTQGTPIVSVNLSEIDVSKVALDQKATITLDSIPDKTFTGKVIGVDRIGAVTSGVTQYPANIQLDSGSEQILPNMTVTANILIDRKTNVLSIPSSAVQSQNGQSFVSILKEGKQQSVPVKTGLTSETQIEIVSGLSEGDLVVTGTVASSGLQRNSTSPFGGSGMRMMRIH